MRFATTYPCERCGHPLPIEPAALRERGVLLTEQDAETGAVVETRVYDVPCPDCHETTEVPARVVEGTANGEAPNPRRGPG